MPPRPPSASGGGGAGAGAGGTPSAAVASMSADNATTAAGVTASASAGAIAVASSASAASSNAKVLSVLAPHYRSSIQTSSTATSSGKKKPAPLQIISNSVRGGAIDRLPSIKRYSRYDKRRPASVDSPSVSQFSQPKDLLPVGSPDISFAFRDLDQDPHPPPSSVSTHRRHASLDSPRRLPSVSETSASLQVPRLNSRPSLRPQQPSSVYSSRYSYSPSLYEDDRRASKHSRASSTMTTFAPLTPYAPATPLTLQTNGKSSNVNIPNDRTKDESISTPPKSPVGKLSSFFGWKSSTTPTIATNGNAATASPATTFSDRSGSPLASPKATGGKTNRVSGSSIDLSENQYAEYYRPDSPAATNDQGATAGQVDELLKELRDVSAELAASIRREMELEDEIDRCRSEIPPTQPEMSRRTSDYYSDSGASSMRYPSADSETKIEGLERMRRKAEQEKAQLRSEMTQKVQDDVIHRKALELHVQSLEVQLQTQASGKPTERERELESTVEDVRRRLNEERQFKENFEDLLAGMREEIESYRNERDNLRDEVVPQLKARVEGLEAEAVEVQKLQYENTKMQQDLQNLKNENQTLVNARKMQLDQQNRFRSIAEEDENPSSPGLNRSNSSASMSRSRSLKQRSGSLSKSGSPSSGSFPDGQTFKDIEDQRDALRSTVKYLLVRQDIQTRQHVKQLRALQKEKNDLLHGHPRRHAFNVEVKSLRSEIDKLRQRADDAMEQKWQCEKGLSGLKMDLDRAKQETTSLRELLKEHDIFIPPSISTPTEERSQESLEKAYENLRTTHTDSMTRIRSGTTSSTRRPASLEAAEARMEALAMQVQQQLKSNKELRERLAEAIGRGETEQDQSAKQITDLQAKLKEVEDQLMAAQEQSEDSIAVHEDHVRQLKDSQTAQSVRGISRSMTAPRVPTTTLRSPLFDARSPRLDRTTTGLGISFAEASKTAALETRVQELEATAVQAEEEMQGVVERMNRAQIEVAELQAERDEAMRQTRRLQREIEAERIRAKALAT